MRFRITLFLAFLLVLAGCNDTIPVGSGVLPGDDNPDNIFTDTTTVISTTVTDDSLRSDKVYLSQLGYMQDPVFGTTKASLLIGFGVPNSAVSPALLDTIEGYALDSVVLSLVLNGIYGDSSLTSAFTVYKLASPYSNTTPYYSNINFGTGMVEVGRLTGYVPRLSEQYDEDTAYTDLGAQMRIRLNPYFGQSLINILKSDQIRSAELLRQYLPGLVIVPDEVPASMLEINMIVNTGTSVRADALKDSRLHLYFRNGKGDTLDVIFPGTVVNLGIGKYEHDYASTNVETALGLSNPDGDEVNYIQGLAGVKTLVKFPYLADLGPNVAINKAELVVTQLKDGYEDLFPPPERIFALKVNDDGTSDNISDFTLFTSAHYGGFYEEVTVGGSPAYQYRINVSDYVQRILKGQEPNNGLYLTLYGDQITTITSVNSSDLVPDRIVIGGGRNTSDDARLRLELSYTIFE